MERARAREQPSPVRVGERTIYPVRGERPLVVEQAVADALRAPLEQSLEHKRQVEAERAQRKAERADAARGSRPDTRHARDGPSLIAQMRENCARAAERDAAEAARVAAEVPALLRELDRLGVDAIGVKKLAKLVKWSCAERHEPLPDGCTARSENRATLVATWRARAPDDLLAAALDVEEATSSGARSSRTRSSSGARRARGSRCCRRRRPHRRRARTPRARTASSRW